VAKTRLYTGGIFSGIANQSGLAALTPRAETITQLIAEFDDQDVARHDRLEKGREWRNKSHRHSNGYDLPPE